MSDKRSSRMIEITDLNPNELPQLDEHQTTLNQNTNRARSQSIQKNSMIMNRKSQRQSINVIYNRIKQEQENLLLDNDESNQKYERYFMKKYEKKENFDKIYDDLLEILKTVPSNRSNQQVYTVYRFLSSYKFFKEMIESGQSNLAKKICQQLGYIQQDQSIIDGKMQEKKMKRRQTRMQRKKSRSMDFKLKGIQYELESEEDKYQYQRKIVDQIQRNPPIEDMEGIKKVASLTIGQSFGELALIYNQSRQASVVCNKKTDFAILEKKQYQSILKEFENKKVKKQVALLKDFGLFQNFKDSQLIKIYLSSKIMNYQRNQIVYRQDDDCGHVYFILEGQFVTFKGSESTDKFENKVVDQFDRDDLQQSKERWEKFTNREKVNKISNNRKIKTNFIENVKPQNQKVPLELLIQSKGQFFGDQDVISNQKRKFNVSCHSLEGSLLQVPQDIFIQKIYDQQETNQNIQNTLQAQKQKLKIIESNYQLSNQIQNICLQPHDSRQKVKERFGDQYILKQLYTARLKGPNEHQLINGQKMFRNIEDCLDCDESRYKIDSSNNLMAVKQRIHMDFYIQQVKKRNQLRKELFEQDNMSISDIFRKTKSFRKKGQNKPADLDRNYDATELAKINEASEIANNNEASDIINKNNEASNIINKNNEASNIINKNNEASNIINKVNEKIDINIMKINEASEIVKRSDVGSIDVSILNSNTYQLINRNQSQKMKKSQSQTNREFSQQFSNIRTSDNQMYLNMSRNDFQQKQQNESQQNMNNGRPSRMKPQYELKTIKQKDKLIYSQQIMELQIKTQKSKQRFGGQFNQYKTWYDKKRNISK